MNKYKAEFYKGNELKATVSFVEHYSEIGTKVAAQSIMYIYKKLYGCDNIKVVKAEG